MSTLQLKGFKNKTTLPHFKSTNSIHPRTRHARTPGKHPNHSYFPSHSPSIDHDSTMTSKALLQTNLPDIHSKKSSQKRSTFLQMWLDEALDPQDRQEGEESPQLRVDVDKTGPLRTVQKFEIDKKYLKSQNISVELIDKMYHSLYVYTYGINHTFQQILSLTKASQHTEKRIVQNFWKAFIRLLEGCTSFQTTFQIIEQSHIKGKQELKYNYRIREQQWMKEKSDLEAQNIRLMKKINEQGLTISKITADFNISEATLQLTDQAFNDEVNVRLMFEEKVNAIFSSYDQLRNKYSQLLCDLRTRELEEQAANKRESKLQKQLQLSLIRLAETTKQLERAKKDIQTRQVELALKRQEIFQLQGINQQLVDEKGQNDEQVRKIVNKVTYYKNLYEEQKAESNTKAILLAETQKRLEEQDKELQVSRSIEEKLYLQLQQNSLQISSLKQRAIQLSLELDQAKAERDNANQKVLQLQSANLELSSSIVNLQKDLTQAQGELIIKNSLIEKNSASICALQAVNAKLQSLLSATTLDKTRNEAELHKAVEICERFKEEMIGMKMLLESKGTELEQLQKKLENEREVFRSKIGGLKDEIQFKENKVMQMHNQHAEGQDIVKKAEEQMQKLSLQNGQLRNHKLNLESQLVQLKIRIEALQNEIQKKGVAFRDLEQVLTAKEQQLKRCQHQLNQKQSLLDTEGKHYQLQSQQLRGLLQGYREDRERKVSYVHPMLYEDALEQINNLTQNKERLIKLCKQKDQQLVKYQIELQKIQKQADEQIQQVRRSALLSEEKLSVLKEKQRLLQSKLQSNQSLEEAENKRYIQHISTLQKERDSFNSKIDELKVEVLAKTTAIAKLENNLSTSQSQKQQLQQKVKALNQRLLSSQLQVAKLCERNIVLENQKIESQQVHIHQAKGAEERESRPQLHQKQTQTQKKFNHSFKFEIAQQSTSFAVQASSEEIVLETRDEREIPARDREIKKVQANQFKRALKITYMRR